ncbi:hypothetical protein AB833_27195 [Chromatiales bacterium (ex Bugula neritina AB1)]|nr:hypothetical protein AB833_27195 [Chromatiales bacterium (ex Bugula neritina AB1)]
MISIARFKKLFWQAALALWIALTAINLTTVSYAAEPQDHIVVVRSEQTVAEIVEYELQSIRYARQIAAYNGIDSVASLLPVGAILQIPRPYMDLLDFGRINFVKGDVAHTKTDLVVNPPKNGAAVHSGDIIRTGSDGFVSLSFNSGARVNLQPNSRVIVKDIDCARSAEKCVISLQATEGQVASEVTPAAKDDKPVQFSVDTPFLSAAVRGTAFYVDVENEVNRIGVTKGLVAAKSGNSQFELPKGQGLSAAAGIPAQQVALLAAPTLVNMSENQLFSAEDSINWLELDGAAAYETTVASDAEMSQTVVLQRGGEKNYYPELEAGEYYISVSGVDQQEFVGLATRSRIRVAEISERTQPSLNIERRGGVVSVSMSNYSGPAQLHLGHSFDANDFEVRIIDSMAEPVLLSLAEDQDWVIRLRKVLGPTAVSSYSNYYVLNAVE